MRPDLLQRVAARLLARQQAGLLRHLQHSDAVQGIWQQRGGRRLRVFCSNDYLGLAGHPDLHQALTRAAAECGLGSTSAHLLCGHHRHHAALEEAMADWLGRERALLFSTGYMANIGVLQALLTRGDLCVQDRLNHACLLDGARLSGAELLRYPHLGVDAAARQLARRPQAAAMLATDGVFSMDGDVAPLVQLAETCRQQQALMMVDDAHGLGVLGLDGAGSVAEAGLNQQQVPVLMVTLGKALGGFGAVVAGSGALCDALTNEARSHVYTTAMPPALAAAMCVAVGLARSAGGQREHLQQLIRQFRHGAQQLGLPLMNSSSPIQPLLLGDSLLASQVAGELQQRGFLVPAIRPPTVLAGQARLRITLSAAHSERDVRELLDALGQCLPVPGDALPASGLIADAH